MLSEELLAIADRWWAGDFACRPEALRPEIPHVQAHAGRMTAAPGIWILLVGPAPLVSAPSAAVDSIADRARGWSRARVMDPAALAKDVEHLEVGTIVGPAFIGYGTAETLDLAQARGARVLTPTDEAAVARLRAACADEAWEHGGSDARAVPTFGCFDERGELLALAGYRTWAQEIAHLSIVAAPEHQGRGHASSAVACAAQHALEAGLLPQYRTLAANAPSMGIARKLGFECYGYSVFIRLGAGPRT
ncbi:MAG: GNAT family N-acetyltransferase [Planctomycetota bacterium]|nr:GNAT family N-acetyltransferase [Planctomycetota bacterium]